MHRYLIASLVIVTLAAGAAWAGGRDDYFRALEIDKSGDHEGALKALESLAAAGADFSDDALMEAGRISEEALLDGPRAASYYERLTRDFPNSRLVRRASSRAEAIRSVDPGHLKATLRFRRAVLDFSRDRKGAVAGVKKLLEENPDWPSADNALFWLAEAARDDGDLSGSADLHGRIISRRPDGVWAARSMRALGEMAYSRRDFSIAAEFFEQAEIFAEPQLKAVIHEDLERARNHLMRERLALLSFAALLLGWLYAITGIRRAGAPAAEALKPLTETIAALAASAVIVILSAVFQKRFTAAAAAIAVVLAVSIQLSGVLLRHRRYGASGKAVYFLTSLAVTAFAFYGILAQAGLVGAVIHTLKFGPGK